MEGLGRDRMAFTAHLGAVVQVLMSHQNVQFRAEPVTAAARCICCHVLNINKSSFSFLIYVQTDQIFQPKRKNIILSMEVLC